MAASSSRLSGKRRLLVSGGAVLAAGALVTAAAFTDQANINLFGSGSGGGVGSKTSFALQTQAQGSGGLGDGDGTWLSANTTAVDWVLPGGDKLTPGDEVSVVIPLRNNKEANKDGAKADLKFSVGTVAGKTEDQVLKDKIRYTVAVAPVNGGTIGSYTTKITNADANDVKDPADLFTGLDPEKELVVKVSVKIDGSAGSDIQGKSVYPLFKVAAETK